MASTKTSGYQSVDSYGKIQNPICFQILISNFEYWSFQIIEIMIRNVAIGSYFYNFDFGDTQMIMVKNMENFLQFTDCRDAEHFVLSSLLNNI